MTFTSVNPATHEQLASFESLESEALNAKVALGADAFSRWRATSYRARAQALIDTAAVMLAEKVAIAHVATAEMGKPIASAVAEVEKCALACTHYAEHGQTYLADETISTEASRSFIKYQPLGVILAVMPWNFPLWQVFRFAAPALFAGNVCLLKHAPNVPQTALLIEDVFRRGGLPPGVFQNLFIEVDQIKPLLEDARVVAATLTGSEAAGKSLAQIAGSQIKKTVLELGGSDPFIVMPSAMSTELLARSVSSGAVKGRTINTGQSCIASKRFIVADSIFDKFAKNFVDGMRALKTGDPMDPETDLGPIATERLLDNLDAQVQRAMASGAQVLTGGRRLPGRGNFYEPTVLTNVKRGQPIYYEEFFGPVAMLFNFRTIDEAVEIANDTRYGLASSVWTEDVREQEHFIKDLEAGAVFINSTVASDVRLAFGGIKRSGYGRELGALGIKEFTNIKTVWIK